MIFAMFGFIMYANLNKGEIDYANVTEDWADKTYSNIAVTESTFVMRKGLDFFNSARKGRRLRKASKESRRGCSGRRRWRL